MPNYIELSIYQLNSRNDYDASFPLYRQFPVKSMFVQSVAPPLNTAQGVLCYGAIRIGISDTVYYTNLTLAQIIDAANADTNSNLLISGTDSLLISGTDKLLIS